MFFKIKKNYRQENTDLMEIYKDLSNPASQEFEKLLSSQLSKVHIEEAPMHMQLAPVKVQMDPLD